MSPEVWWALFGLPLFVMAVAWVGLSSEWSVEVNRTLMTIAMFFPTAATLIGCCALAYVQLGGRVEGYTLGTNWWFMVVASYSI